MKQEIKNQITALENEINSLESQIGNHYKAQFNKGIHNPSSEWYRANIEPLHEKQENAKREIAKLRQQGVEVGDGVTIHLYSDSHAYTIIKRTAKTITIQRDKAILDPNFKPEWIEGGFAGHCTNQEEQSYTYEADTTGEVKTLHWSDKLNGWKTPYNSRVSLGRHEFYDYNF